MTTVFINPYRPIGTIYLTDAQAERMGYSHDRRRRRAQHRAAARSLQAQGGGSIIRSVVAWHLQQARRP